MMWQLVAIWAIVIVTVVWFVRDERKLADIKLRDAALRFAHTPHYRHAQVATPAKPAPDRPRGLRSADRDFLKSYLKRG